MFKTYFEFYLLPVVLEKIVHLKSYLDLVGEIFPSLPERTSVTRDSILDTSIYYYCCYYYDDDDYHCYLLLFDLWKQAVRLE